MSAFAASLKDRSSHDQQAFDAWASVYDERVNPLLTIEQRFLLEMLPDVQGKDVLDIGCGTGRWLELIANKLPGTLTGIDPSPEMLSRASAKSIRAAKLYHATCAAIPLPDVSIDVALISFVLSYVPDIDIFVRELNRIVRSGAHIFISDMHPRTQSELKWKRSFRNSDEQISIEPQQRSIDDIVRSFQGSGFEVRSILEPAFGDPEKNIFEESGKTEQFRAAENLPAIYIFHLQKKAGNSSQAAPCAGSSDTTQIEGGRIALGPNESVPAAITTNAGIISWISGQPALHPARSASPQNVIDLSGYLLLPGLINSHDHLEFGLFPRIGDGPYKNAAAWAQDIHSHHAGTIATYSNIPKDVRVWWGGIRNLLCGVTTVCHHNPLMPELLGPLFPVRVLSRFGWAHSLYADDRVIQKFQSTPSNFPFIIHAAEGLDEDSVSEIFQLNNMRVLDNRTVLIHGLALTHDGVQVLNERGASLVICPSSNRFLFDQTPDRLLLDGVKHIALGNDSPLTAAGNLLDELRFTHSEMGFSPEKLYAMVTTKSAAILHLAGGEGSLVPNGVADIIAVRDVGLSPSETLLSLTADQIELVVIAGRIQLASSSLFEKLPSSLKQGLQSLQLNSEIRWIRAPLDKLFLEVEKHLGRGPISLSGMTISPLAVH